MTLIKCNSETRTTAECKRNIAKISRGTFACNGYHQCYFTLIQKKNHIIINKKEKSKDLDKNNTDKSNPDFFFERCR